MLWTIIRGRSISPSSPDPLDALSRDQERLEAEVEALERAARFRAAQRVQPWAGEERRHEFGG